MRITSITAVAAAMAALAVAPVGAQHVCGDTETVTGCQTRLVDAARAAASTQSAEAEDAGGDENEELQKKATGPNVSESLAQSAIRDFLPRFAGSLIATDPAEDLRALDLRFNTPLGADSAGPWLTFQGGVTIHKAELYGPLIDSIPESIRDASRKRLADELEDGDDATAFIAINPEGPGIGRSFASHQANVDGLAREIVDSATANVKEPDEVAQFDDAFLASIGEMESIDPNRHNDPSCIDFSDAQPNPRQGRFLPVSCLTAERRGELDRLLTPVSRYIASRQIAIASELGDAGFDRIAELVNNQPQINITAEYRSRVAEVGPNEWVGRVRGEIGLADMNGLRRHCRRENARNRAAQTDTAAARAGVLNLGCLRSYTQSERTRSRLARSDRFWAAGEVRYRPEYSVEFADDSVAFTLGSGIGWGLSGGYGRYLGSADEDDEDRDRIDLHVSYDHADGEDLRQTRFLAGLFYTLRLSGNASGVVGLAWANKPEFLAGADRRLHANLGLSYKFNRGKKED
jgi:hypothetical protein